MRDPLAVFETLRDYYISYYETPFELRDPGLSAERRKLLLQPGEIAQEPLLELLPKYQSSLLTLSAAATSLDLATDFSDFATAGLFPPNRELYLHQLQALELASQGENFVVTAGTGSGKTEAFLLPVVLRLIQESGSWSAPKGAPDAWWRGEGSWVPQRASETRPAAVRCIVLYPMNALVEDQLRRLREGLDGPLARDWLDSNRQKNRFYFGRYTGRTPVSGEPDTRARVEELRTQLKKLESTASKVSGDEKRRYFFPQLDGAEMCSRWDMIEHPPDVLITNYSMLNVMLMREREENIFDLTAQWLEADSNHVLTLVVDELHMYRGTAGSEVALMLRNLRRRLGIEKRPEQIAIYAASASLSGDDSGLRYVRQFFADPRFSPESFLPGRRVDLPPPSKRRPQEREALGRFGSEWKEAGNEPQQRAATTRLAEGLEVPEPSPTLPLRNALGEVALAAELPNLLGSAFGPPECRPEKISSLSTRLFPTAGQVNATAGFRGLLAAVADGSQADGSPLAQMRGHLFFRSIRGAWACSNPDCPPVAPELRTPERRIGRVFLQPQFRCVDECGARVLELLYCEMCGEAFLGGYRKPASAGVAAFTDYLLPEAPDLELLPDLPPGGRTHDRYMIYWPSKSVPVDNAPWTIGGARLAFTRAKFEPRTGQLDRQPDGATGWAFTVNPPSPDDRLTALPTRCPRCGEDTAGPALVNGQPLPLSERLRSSLRTMGTGFERISQVLADAQMRLIRDSAGVPRLVVFSDSRQDAAKLSTGLEASHYQDLVRQLICQSIQRLGEELRAYTDSVESGKASEEAARYEAANPAEALAVYRYLRGDATEAQRQVAERVLAQAGGPWPVARLRSMVEQELLALGVNPGGPNFQLQQYRIGDVSHSWTDLVDFDSSPPRFKTGLGPEATSLLAQIRDQLRDQFRFTFFARRGRDLESLGIAWVTFDPSRSTTGTLRQAASGAIRILGARNRIVGKDRLGVDNMPAYLRRYLDASADRQGTPKAEFRSDIEALLKDSRVLQAGWLLDVDQTWVAEAGNEIWRCPECRRLCLHGSGGVCTNTECLKQSPIAEPAIFTPGVLDHDYFEVLARYAGEPFRLHCEELTGQTDLDDSLKRQRLFQAITLDEDVPSVDTVDLLSVTTTMEAGVDIGSLSTVMMSNVPPRRFNYQQRVGRAGRREEALAVAITIGRGRTHDDFYFNNAERITGDPPPPPYIDLTRPEIARRVLAAEVLRLAFKELQRKARALGQALDLGNNTHGQFGRVTDWADGPRYRDGVADWLKGARDKIEDIVSQLLREAPDEIVTQSAVLVEFASKDLVDAVDEAISQGPAFQEDLSELLANRGLLPMFGFPSRSRLLFHARPSASDWPPTKNVIDRDLDIAISQFAPRGQTVKDKAIYTSVGVVGYERKGPRIEPVGDPLFSPAKAGVCRTCHGLTTQDVPTCPVCGEGRTDRFTVHDLCEPPGFRTDYLRPKPYEGQFEWTPQASRARVSEGDEVSSRRSVSGLSVTVRSGSSRIYAMNDNDGQDFEFVPDPTRHGYVVPAAYERPPQNLPKGPIIKRALASITTTDVLLVGIDEESVATGVAIRPTSLVARAAWYSFGFLLRAVAAKLLDVDVNELDVGLRIFAQGGTPRAEVFISDSLENGAGYSTYLATDAKLRELFDAIGSDDDPDTLAWKWARHQQAGKPCDSSCYDCLRDYSNMAFHGLLDWRLALDLADLAAGRPLQEDRWLANAKAFRDQLCTGFNWIPMEFSDVQAMQRGATGDLVLLVHPLWNTDPLGFGPTLASAYDEAKSAAAGRSVVLASLFDAVRRPGQLAWLQ